MKKFLIIIFIFFCGYFFAFSSYVRAELLQDKIITVKAKVLEAIQEDKTIDGNVRGKFQQLKVQILEGGDTGKVVTVEDDYINLSKGDTFFSILPFPPRARNFTRLPTPIGFRILLYSVLFFWRRYFISGGCRAFGRFYRLPEVF